MPNYNDLLELLAQKLNVPQSKLQDALQQNNPNAVAALLSGEQASALQKVLSNPQAAKKLLNSKESAQLQRALKK